jgi:predicted nucleotidyltransferase
MGPQVEAYLADVLRACEAAAPLVESVLLFGSAATGGYARAVSDVDLLFVVRDAASGEDRARLGAAISALEARHGVGKDGRKRRGRLERFADRLTANERAFFICTRAELLSGDPARVLGLSRWQAAFVDRVALPSILGSAVVLWGEALHGAVPLPPIRRLDVGKACFGLVSQVLFAAVAYPALPRATGYAMDALKRSVHSCYFCTTLRVAPLEEEVAHLDRTQGRNRARARLLELRRAYEPSFGFVLATLVAVVRQHAITARDQRFPRELDAAGERPAPAGPGSPRPDAAS